VSSIDEAICALIAKLKQWGAPTSMNDLNILNNDFEKIAELSISEGIPGKIKPLYKEDIINILKLTNEL